MPSDTVEVWTYEGMELDGRFAQRPAAHILRNHRSLGLLKTANLVLPKPSAWVSHQIQTTGR